MRVLLWLLVGAALAAAVQVARMAPEERAGALRVERTPASLPARVAPAPGGDAGQAGVRGPGATGPRPASAPAGDAATAGTAAGTPPWPRDTGHAPPAAPPVAATPGPSGLLVPVQGVDPASLQPTFDDARGEGRAHEALDIMAPAGTPVLAVADGHVEKLFDSERGGLTLYQFEPTGRYAYYYAHLARYAEGIAEGQALRRGQVIGYVGSTGNADPAAPHLHFAIFELGPERQWWKGRAIDPWPLLAAAPRD